MKSAIMIKNTTLSIRSRFFLFPILFLLASCRDNVKMNVRENDQFIANDATTSTYIPGSKVVISQSGGDENESFESGESTIPLFTANASLICSDLTFYNVNGDLAQGTRDCAETLPDCSQDGQTACVATEANPSIVKAELESKIIAGEMIAGVEGAASGDAYSACTAAGQAGCIATNTYKTMDLSLADTSTDLTAANFNTSVATASNFEFWDATGNRHVVSGTSNLTAVNIKDGITIFGVPGGLTGAPPTCSSDGEGSCLVDGTNYRAAATVLVMNYFNNDTYKIFNQN